jgi:hypothetical protein
MFPSQRPTIVAPPVTLPPSSPFRCAPAAPSDDVATVRPVAKLSDLTNEQLAGRLWGMTEQFRRRGFEPEDDEIVFRCCVTGIEAELPRSGNRGKARLGFVQLAMRWLDRPGARERVIAEIARVDAEDREVW